MDQTREIETKTQRNAAEIIIDLSDAPSRSRHIDQWFTCKNTICDVEDKSISEQEYIAQHLLLTRIQLSRIRFICDSLRELSNMGFSVDGLVVLDGGYLDKRLNSKAILVDSTGCMYLDIDVVKFEEKGDKNSMRDAVDRIESAFIFTFWERCSIHLMALNAYLDDSEGLANLFNSAELESVIEKVMEYTYDVLELLYEIDFNTWYRAILSINEIETIDAVVDEFNPRVVASELLMESARRKQENEEGMSSNEEYVVRAARRLGKVYNVLPNRL
jgi:hypothetical protein